jgi:hypothetical protein
VNPALRRDVKDIVDAALPAIKISKNNISDESQLFGLGSKLIERKVLETISKTSSVVIRVGYSPAKK